MEQLNIDAVYQRGMLKLPCELPLQEGQKVPITIHPTTAKVRRRRGVIQWKGSQEDLDHLILSEDNDSLEASQP
jgi:predicted DNA-binding antitoxin AbrB/MazE fold protein